MIRQMFVTVLCLTWLSSWSVSAQLTKSWSSAEPTAVGESASVQGSQSRTRPPGHRALDEGQRPSPRAQRGTNEGLPENPEMRFDDPGWDRHRSVGRWYLGVDGYNTPTGVRITKVARHGPARRAGFEVGDTIVAVNGFQIGIVNGYVYYLWDELQRQANFRGEVHLLVQNRRNRQLLNVNVLLAPSRLARAR